MIDYAVSGIEPSAAKGKVCDPLNHPHSVHFNFFHFQVTFLPHYTEIFTRQSFVFCFYESLFLSFNGYHRHPDT